MASFPSLYFMKSHWDNYVKKSQEQPIPNELVSAIKLVEDKSLALDLGCGSGNFSLYLAEQGFVVIAIDIADSALKSTKQKMAKFPFSLAHEDLNNFSIIGNYNFILAWRSISFLAEGNDIAKYKEIKNAITKNGVFVFSVFGKEDDWVKNGTVRGITLKKMKAIFTGYIFSSVSEKKFRDKGVSGEVKNWHFIQGVAQKK